MDLRSLTHRARIGLVAGVAAATLFGTTGCSLLGDDSPGSTPSGSATPSPTAPAHYAGDLGDLLLKAPAGSKPWDDVDVSGEVTLQQLADAFYTDTADDMVDYLTSWDVERVAIAHWYTDDLDVGIELYQLPDAAQAKGMVKSNDTNGINTEVNEGPFPGYEHSVWFSRADDDDTYADIYVAKEEFVVIVSVWDYKKSDNAAAFQLAKDQIALLSY